MRFLAILPALLVPVLLAGHAVAGDRYADERRKMVEAIRDTVEYTRAYIGRSALDERVMAAMARVPRHEFVPDGVKPFAYYNRPLPIGHGQTISQPYIVALMTDLAAVDENSIVLEVGTGSGYQAAVLAELVAHVYTIEIVEALGRRADRDLQRLGYRNVTVRIGDGYNGWPEKAPFDAIVVTAAPEEVPEPLIQQLKPGGKLVIPVGSQAGAQTLAVIEKDAAGRIRRKDILPVGFVPLTRDQ